MAYHGNSWKMSHPITLPMMEQHIWLGSELTEELLFYPSCNNLVAVRARSGCTERLFNSLSCLNLCCRLNPILGEKESKPE